MDLKNVAPDDLIWAWKRAGGVTARAAELLQAKGYGRIRLADLEAHIEWSRSCGIHLGPVFCRGRFIPEECFMPTAWERHRQVKKRQRTALAVKTRRTKRKEKLQSIFAIVWEAAPDIDTAVTYWKKYVGSDADPVRFRMRAHQYRTLGVTLKVMG